MDKESLNNNRVFGYDMSRIIAIFLVLYNHRPAYNYVCGRTDFINIKYIILAIASIICKCGPPVFFMISGALLLGKEERFSFIVKHRILRIVAIMLVLTVLIWGYNLSTDAALSLKDIFLSKLCWYLYAYVAFLFMCPFLRMIVIGINNSSIYRGVDGGRLFIAITVPIYILSGLFIPFNINEYLTNNFIIYNSKWASSCWHIVFPVLGYIIANQYTDDCDKKKLVNKLMIGTVFSVLLGLALIDYDNYINNGMNLEQIRQHTIMLPSMLIFSVCIFSNSKIFNVKFFSVISSCVFGVFLIETHTSFSKMIYEIIIDTLKVGGGVGSVLSIICEFVLYTSIVYVLKKIPFIDKVL